MDFAYLLWYVVLLRAGASQIKRKGSQPCSTMKYWKWLSRNLQSEGISSSAARIQRSTRWHSGGSQVQECVLPLSQEAQDTLEEYHTTMDILSGHQIRYLYLQGAKDCVSLLRELGVIR